MTEYAMALIVTICIAAANREALLSALVVALNFCINESFVRIAGQYDPWLFFSFTDGLCAAVLVAPYAKLPDFGRVGGAVAAIFCTQVIIHWAHWLTGSTSPYTYWQTLTAMAFVQLLILAAGGVNGMGRLGRWVRRLRPVFPPRNSLARGQAEQGEKP